MMIDATNGDLRGPQRHSVAFGESLRTFVLVSLLTASVGAEPPGAGAGRDRMAIRAGTVLTISTNPLHDATVLIEDGAIRAVGRDVVVPDGVRVVQARDKFVLPGFLDAQSSLYVMAGETSGSAGGEAGWSIADALDPFVERHEEVLRQGVTAVYVAPSGRGGFAGRGAVLSLNGAQTPEKLILKADAAVRASIGVSSNDRSSSLARLDDYANLRETLIETQAYMQRQRRYRQELAEYEKKKAEREKEKEKKDGEEGKRKDSEELKRPDKPPSNPSHEVLAKVLEKEIPLQIEVHRVSDILNALRLAEEFKFSLILDRCTEGYLMAEEIARRKVPVVVGPVSTSFVEMPQLEYRNHSRENATILSAKGIQTALGVSGRDGLSSKFITLAAALAAANGMDRDAALRAITLTPAEIYGVADRIGSLDVGKRADLVVMTGHPFDAGRQVEMVLVGGKVVYERNATP